MNEQQVLRLLRVIRGAYPRVTFTDDTIDAYTVMLKDLPYELAQRAVVDLIRTSQWPPTVAEICRRAAELVDPLPDVDEAYEAARRAAREHSPYDDQNRALEALHPLVRQALLTVGIETMAYTDQPMIAAAQFRQVYERLRESQLIRRQTERGLIAELDQRRRLAAADRVQALPEGRSA